MTSTPLIAAVPLVGAMKFRKRLMVVVFAGSVCARAGRTPPPAEPGGSDGRGLRRPRCRTWSDLELRALKELQPTGGSMEPRRWITAVTGDERRWSRARRAGRATGEARARRGARPRSMVLEHGARAARASGTSARVRLPRTRGAARGRPHSGHRRGYLRRVRAGTSRTARAPARAVRSPPRPGEPSFDALPYC